MSGLALAVVGVVIGACSGAPEQAAVPSAAPATAATTEATPEVSATPGASAAPQASAASEASATPSAAAPPPPPPSRCPANMIEVPGGELAVGKGKAKQKVTVAPFCIDLNETTADEYAACVKGGGCNEDRVKVCDGATYGKPELAKNPMVCVDFTQAEAYCKAQQKRLVTTEEWEWAARGGAEDRYFPWGNDEPGDQACWGGKAGTRAVSCPIGSFPKGDSPLGIHDLGGNVYEWTTSASDKTSTVRQGRGGSWKDSAKDLFRNDRPFIFKTTYRCGFLGIRCATTPQ
ncbi:formylglycine-generating enzyme family protein [Chondromyces apiculatus]|uniref:formylglycine-generating enzyme family protein n=1 Tax=Chondromyces apiculatus TaxID=51 RepID=UPI001E525679|nr:SUMF1/EgtB/PvdO family nonheme iron enzyme [Chondromyces apiculatus]